MVSQEWLAFVSCFIIWEARGCFLVGTYNFWDGNQGEDERIDGKPLQYKMFCDKQADDKLIKGAVCADRVEEGVCDPVAE